MSIIDKKSLKHLADLAKIELTEKEEEKLLHDLKEILEHFEELKEIDTSNVEPMTGGTAEHNVSRPDDSEIRKQINSSSDELVNAFPEKGKGFLKVPPVFE